MEDFISLVDDGSSERCLICGHAVECKTNFTDTSWKTLTDQAKTWSEINIPADDSRFSYTFVYEKIRDLKSPFGAVHETCKIDFRLRKERYKNKFSIKEAISQQTSNSPDREANDVTRPTKIRRISNQKRSKERCFICEEIRECDKRPYNEGGLVRCCEKPTAERLSSKMKEYLLNPESRCYSSALRLQLILSGEAHDIFAADIYYHQSCYIKFAIKSYSLQGKEIVEDESNLLLEEFYRKIEIKVLYERSAFLLNVLMKDLHAVFEEANLDSPIRETKTLRRKLESKFPERIGFYPSGKYLIVYSSDVNPCTYSVATLKGAGLRTSDLAKTFGRMISKKLAFTNQEKEGNFPYSYEELIERLDEGPMSELYNIIFATIQPEFTLTETGYAKTHSRLLATKIWALSSDWESLIKKNKEAQIKQVLTGLTVHRVTASKQTIQMLKKMNHSISYRDIIMQNKKLANNAKLFGSIPPTLFEGIPTHVTLDNNDGCQETMTGKGTTHDTNRTIFKSNYIPAIT